MILSLPILSAYISGSAYAEKAPLFAGIVGIMPAYQSYSSAALFKL